jgi:sugar lactone lactonase YvrE
VGLAQTGGNIYMTSQTTGAVLQINPSTGATIKTVASIPNATGIAVNPSNGHLFVSTYQINTIWDLDPTTGIASPFLSAFLDGLSTDGTTLYGADSGNDHVLGFNIATGQQVFDSGAITGDPDGTALGQGALAGYLFANTNGGTVVAINLATDVQTVIADSGTRGDFVAVDPNNGTVLLTQTDSVYRLTAPSGGTFGGGGGTSAVPVPAAAPQCLALAVMLGLGYAGRKLWMRHAN